jgi:hypothetical protein
MAVELRWQVLCETRTRCDVEHVCRTISNVEEVAEVLDQASPLRDLRSGTLSASSTPLMMHCQS